MGHRDHRRRAGVVAGIELPDTGQLLGFYVLLKEQRAVDAGGGAHQRHRAALQVLEHQIADQAVEANQVELRGARAGIDHALRVRHMLPIRQGLRPGRGGGGGGGGGGVRELGRRQARRAFTHHGAGILVGPQPTKDRMTDAPGACPFTEAPLRHQAWFHPGRLAVDL